MCGNCVTTADALAVGLPLVSAVFHESWRRLTGRHDASAAWDEDAAFLSALGHEPVALLGPRPAAETEDGACRASSLSPAEVTVMVASINDLAARSATPN